MNQFIKELDDLHFKLTQQHIPKLDIADKIGLTGYIDFISSTDMTHFIMKGQDCYSRPFLSIQVTCLLSELSELSELNNKKKDTLIINEHDLIKQAIIQLFNEATAKVEKKNKEKDTEISKKKQFYTCVGTFFPLYTSCDNIAFGTSYYNNLIYNDSRVRTEKELEIVSKRLKKLIAGEIVYDYDEWRSKNPISQSKSEEEQKIIGTGNNVLWCKPRNCIQDAIKDLIYKDLVIIILMYI